MEDFIDDAAYNDYLEEVEDISVFLPSAYRSRILPPTHLLPCFPPTAFNLLNQIDIPSTEARIAAFAAANASTISSNQLLLQEEETAMREREEEERVEREWRREQGRKGKEDEEKDKEKRRLEVLKELVRIIDFQGCS